MKKLKVRWLLKNLIAYKKKEVRQMMIAKRKKDYTFENLDTLLQKEGFEENIISKMREIIREIKNNDFKERIFNFIVESIDAFKSVQDKLLKELNLILEQIKVNFKELVKEKVGDTKDVKEFMEKENCTYYVENNDKNNEYINNREEIIENNTTKKKEIVNTINMKNNKKDKKEKKSKIKKDYELYNGFKVKSFEPEYQYISLDISNTFIANNNNNNYIEKKGKVINRNNNYTYTTIRNYYVPEEPNKNDVLKSLKNIEHNKETEFIVNVNTSNIIEANNNNNRIKISAVNKVFENNNVEETTIYNHNKGLYNKCLEEEQKSKNKNEDITNDILNNEVNKNKESKSDVYTVNTSKNYTKVNNYNNQIIKNKIEISTKNSDIKTKFEYNKEKFKPKDIDYNYNKEIMNTNNNKFIGTSFDNHDKKIINNYNNLLIGPTLENNDYSTNIDAIDKREKIGNVYYYKIKGSKEGYVWGYNIYSDDSNIAKSAVLDGKCKIGEETIVGIKMIEGQSSYSKANKNGISSSPWDYWYASYIFI